MFEHTPDMKFIHSFAACITAQILAVSALAEPVISEFMASNDAILLDGDGVFSDWIEIHNPDPDDADLSGWALRDAGNAWLFPERTIVPAGGYLVVFASGQEVENYTDAAGNLHTTFKLDATGEPLALLRPDGGIAFEYSDVPGQHEDVGYGLVTGQRQLVTPDSPARYRLTDAPLAEDWKQAGFDDSGWRSGSAAIGYKTTPGPVLGGGSGFHTAYMIESGISGNQDYGGSLGMDFDVLEAIRVTDLGVFDSGTNGLSRTIVAQIWIRNGNSGVLLKQQVFTAGDPGTLEGGSRFKELATALILEPGNYTMVAYGYGVGEPNGNNGVGALDGLDIDPGGGLLQFVGGSRYGAAGSFPGSPDRGPANRYAAGSFKYSPHAANDIITDVEGVMFDSSPGILLRVPFAAVDPGDIDFLQLEIGFDDGFVACVNGVEIARRNAPALLAHNSAATAPGNGTIIVPAILPPGTLLPAGNVLAIHGLNITADSDDFLISPTLLGISSNVDSSRYFSRPTPGLPNDPDGILGFVADTQVSVDRGFFETPFELAITTTTEGAAIRYTTDGSLPTETHGTLYTLPLTIGTTTVLRAVAFREEFGSTNVDTQSYLFLDDVAVPNASPPGYPGNWGGVVADYALDTNSADYARAAGNAGFSPAQARAAIVESLRAIPSISIVTDRDNLFDAATGIYPNPSGRGRQWERPVSVEIIGADGSGRYQGNAGLRIMGYTSRNLNTTTKLNMRLLFKKQYGEGRMQYPLLGPQGPDEFNTFALRGNIRDAWVTEYYGFGKATYIGDEWAKRTQFAMGQPASRGTFAHVYLNGIYWGLYNPSERPDDVFAAHYIGGEASEYDVVKFCCPDRSIAGSIDVWDDLLTAARFGLGGDAAYQRIQGNDPDGTPNPALPVLLDVDNLIDYVINGQYHAQADWPGNYYVSRDRVEGRSGGFKFFTWDNDIALGGADPNVGNKVQTSAGHNWWTESPGEVEIAIRANAEYRMRFADRVYKHYHHGGALTVDNNIARWQNLAALVRPALFAESARWGDARGSALRTVQDHWDVQDRAMVNTYFPNRQAVVFSQMRAHNLYPDLDAPEFNRHGGHVPPGFTLRFSADATVYYTTDGSDPRLYGGALSPAASSASTGLAAVSLLQTGAVVRALVPRDGLEGDSWSEPDFDDSAWLSGTTGVGYDVGVDFEDEISLDLIDTMRNVHPGVYLRIPFGGANAADFQDLSLRMKYDDGFVAYLNGVRIAARNAPDVSAWDSQAIGFHADQQALVFEDIDITSHRNLLSSTGNVLAIHGLNLGAGSSDFLIVPEIRGQSLGAGDAVMLDTSTRVRMRAFDGSEWSALNEATFIVGAAADATRLVISEIMYHPAGSDTAGEFIEVMNISAGEGLDLTGVNFTDGIEFSFPLGFILGPGERAVAVADPAAFATAHPAVRVAGSYSGALDNGGERVALADSSGSVFLAFDYDDRLPWPESPDGGGPSLVLISPERAPDHSLAANWRASTSAGGNPGASDAVPFAGGNLISYALASLPRLIVSATGEPQLIIHRNLAADAADISLEVSGDLKSWLPATANPVSENDLADGTLEHIYGFDPPLQENGRQWFVRVVVMSGR